MRSGVAEGSRPNCVVPELEAVLGKTHRTEFEGGRLETWAMVGLGTRSAIERAESGNSQPKAARASALPDSIYRWRLVASPHIGARARCARPPTPRRCCILPGGRICSAYTRRILPCWKGIPL